MIKEFDLIQQDCRVCKDWYPKGTYKGQKSDGFWMEVNLQENIIILAKNIVQDWDFAIIISGNGEVRVGKSMLELQIMAYWHWLMEKMYGLKLPLNVKNNLVFNGDDLIQRGHYLGEHHKYSALGYDEAGEDLESDDSGTKKQKKIKKYIRECGQYNLLNIFVLPEFFALKNWLALTRSRLLINVDYTMSADGKFERGYYKVYSMPNKKQLYVQGKKTLNYHAAPFDFSGRFYKFYPIDEEDYRQAKKKALLERDEKEGIDKRTLKLYMTLFAMTEELNLSARQITEMVNRYGAKNGITISTDLVWKALEIVRKLNPDLAAQFNLLKVVTEEDKMGPVEGLQKKKRGLIEPIAAN